VNPLPPTSPPWYDARLPPPQPPLVQHTGTSWLAAHAYRAVPALSTGTMLVLARIWHIQGADQSPGAVALMIALAGGAFAAAAISARGEHGDPLITATAFTASGAFGLAAPVAYTDSWALACLIWLIATVLVYALAARHWRAARALREARAHELALARLAHTAHVTVAHLQAHERAQALAYGLALHQALDQRHRLDPITYNPAALYQAGLPDLPALGTQKENPH
jgi:hypothetical protein